MSLPRSITAIVLWAFGYLTFGQSTNAPQWSLVPPGNANIYTSMETLDDRQRLGPGDTLSYRVLEDREDPRSLVVTDAGELAIPYLGRVKAADKTCKQLAYEIKEALEGRLYYKATVIVAIDLLNKKRGTVYLFGQVRNPGAIEIPSDEILTVSKAILRAGGFGEFANKKKVRVTRGDMDSQLTDSSRSSISGGAPGTAGGKVIELDVGEILEKGRLEADLRLGPGDLVFVPSRLINF